MAIKTLVPSRMKMAALTAVAALSFAAAPANAYKLTIEVPLVDVDISIEVCVASNGTIYCADMPA